jgi:hypothetical protein
MPRSATRLAQYGWSAHWGTTTWGTPARVAVVVVPAPSWCTTARDRLDGHPGDVLWWEGLTGDGGPGLLVGRHRFAG